jgi:hypothetical protein
VNKDNEPRKRLYSQVAQESRIHLQLPRRRPVWGPLGVIIGAALGAAAESAIKADKWRRRGAVMIAVGAPIAIMGNIAFLMDRTMPGFTGMGSIVVTWLSVLAVGVGTYLRLRR